MQAAIPGFYARCGIYLSWEDAMADAVALPDEKKFFTYADYRKWELVGLQSL
jgi:hypothetical protein